MTFGGNPELTQISREFFFYFSNQEGVNKSPINHCNG